MGAPSFDIIQNGRSFWKSFRLGLVRSRRPPPPNLGTAVAPLPPSRSVGWAAVAISPRGLVAQGADGARGSALFNNLRFGFMQLIVQKSNGSAAATDHVEKQKRGRFGGSGEVAGELRIAGRDVFDA